MVLYSLTVFLITSSSTSSSPSSLPPSSRPSPCSPSLPAAVLIRSSTRRSLLFSPVPGLHNARAVIRHRRASFSPSLPPPPPSPSALSAPPRSFSLAPSLAGISRQARLLIPVPGSTAPPLNNNYSAILSAILYRKRKVGGRVKRTRRTRARWMAGRDKDGAPR